MGDTEIKVNSGVVDDDVKHENLPTHWSISGSLDTVRFPEKDAGQDRIVRLLRKYSVAQIVDGNFSAERSTSDDESKMMSGDYVEEPNDEQGQ